MYRHRVNATRRSRTHPSSRHDHGLQVGVLFLNFAFRQRLQIRWRRCGFLRIALRIEPRPSPDAATFVRIGGRPGDLDRSRSLLGAGEVALSARRFAFCGTRHELRLRSPCRSRRRRVDRSLRALTTFTSLRRGPAADDRERASFWFHTRHAIAPPRGRTSPRPSSADRQPGAREYRARRPRQ